MACRWTSTRFDDKTCRCSDGSIDSASSAVTANATTVILKGAAFDRSQSIQVAAVQMSRPPGADTLSAQRRRPQTPIPAVYRMNGFGRRTVASFAVLVAGIVPAPAMPRAPSAGELKVTQAAKPPVIDGVVNEEEWRGAALFDDFSYAGK